MWFTSTNIKNSFRAKHPRKVHVWAGISVHGPTQICIIVGVMDAVLYTKKHILNSIHSTYD